MERVWHVCDQAFKLTGCIEYWSPGVEFKPQVRRNVVAAYSAEF